MHSAAASGKSGSRGSGMLGRQIEQGLLVVFEVRGDDELAAPSVQAEALADVLEAALDGERGRGEDDGRDGFEDQLVRGVPRRRWAWPGGMSCVTAARGRWRGEICRWSAAEARRSIQIDHVAGVGLEQEFELGAEAGDALAQAGGFVDALEVFHFGFEAAQVARTREIEVARGFEELFAAVEGLAAVAGDGQTGEKEAGTSRSCWVTAGVFGALPCRAACASVSRASSSKRMIADGEAEVLEATSSSSCASSKMTAAASGRMPASGAPAACCLTARSAKNRWWLTMMMSDSSALAAHLGDEAAAIIGACRAEAGFGARVQLVPERAGLGDAGDFGAVAGFGSLLPLGDLVVLVDLLQAGQDGLVAQGDQLVAAEIVGAALHVADAQLASSVSRKGTSRKKSWSCRALVPVETMTRWPVRRAGSK